MSISLFVAQTLNNDQLRIILVHSLYLNQCDQMKKLFFPYLAIY